MKKTPFISLLLALLLVFTFSMAVSAAPVANDGGDREDTERCEREHLTAVSAIVKVNGIHKYPYSVDVTFSNGETREYVAQEFN